MKNVIACVNRSRRLGVLFLLATVSSASLQEAYAISSETNDSVSAISDWAKPLRTKVPSPQDKRPPRYILEVESSQAVKPMGNGTVNAVELPSPTVKGGQTLGTPDAERASVALTRPPLKALVSVQENLNPFSMDAKCIEKVDLEDSLRAALGQNLDIANSFTQVRIQKYSFLAALSGFLPDINSGYSLFGIHGSFPGSFLGSTAPGAAGVFGSSGSSIHLPSSAQLLSAAFTYHAYQGGKVLFGTLEQKHRLRAARAALKGNVNDVLLDAARRYYDLVLNESFLATRSRTVAISQEQVRLNSAQEKQGLATGLDVLQSQAQLASDEQNLVDQQQARRNAAIQLAHVCNSSFAQDLVPKQTELKKLRLVPKTAAVEELLKSARDNRPELKQYEELRLAAKRAIVVAAAPLQPKAQLSGTVYGISAAPELGSLSSIFVLNFGINWTLGALGTTDLANIQGARWQARQAAIQAKQSFQTVFEQVRTAYDQSLAADKRIEHATIQNAAAEEELKIAKKRMEAGIGLNIDVLNAQRDLTQAQINKAQAIIDFNIAQAQLVHNMGLITIETLTSGLKI
jgi:OMF family outer membrane factor